MELSYLEKAAEYINKYYDVNGRASFKNYILPGQLRLIGLYNVGRVWLKDDHSNQWHNGVGRGFYFATTQMALFQFVMSYSPKGWYPLFSIGFRF